jgi:hypothetical protein
VSLTRLERRIRFAASIMFVALLLEIGGLAWAHPLSFAFVHLLSMALFALGCAVYLLSLLPVTPDRSRLDTKLD